MSSTLTTCHKPIPCLGHTEQRSKPSIVRDTLMAQWRPIRCVTSGEWKCLYYYNNQIITNQFEYSPVGNCLSLSIAIWVSRLLSCSECRLPRRCGRHTWCPPVGRRTRPGERCLSRICSWPLRWWCSIMLLLPTLAPAQLIFSPPLVKIIRGVILTGDLRLRMRSRTTKHYRFELQRRIIIKVKRRLRCMTAM